MENHNAPSLAPGRRGVQQISVDKMGSHIVPGSFMQTGDITQPDGTTIRYMTIHARRVQQLPSTGARLQESADP